MSVTVATPFTLTMEGMRDSARPFVPETDPDWWLHASPDFFEPRQPIMITDDDPEAVVERVWLIYQDAPDRKPSMQMGDLVRLQRDEKETWWLILAIGVRQIKPPHWRRLSLTPRQKRAIQWLLAANDRPLADHPDHPSAAMINALMRKGVLDRDATGKITVKKIFREM